MQAELLDRFIQEKFSLVYQSVSLNLFDLRKLFLQAFKKTQAKLSQTMRNHIFISITLKCPIHSQIWVKNRTGGTSTILESIVP